MIKLYQVRVSKAFNKKVKQRIFCQENLVLVVKATHDHDA